MVDAKHQGLLKNNFIYVGATEVVWKRCSIYLSAGNYRRGVQHCVYIAAGSSSMWGARGAVPWFAAADPHEPHPKPLCVQVSPYISSNKRPPPRYEHAVALVGSQMILIGGSCGA